MTLQQCLDFVAINNTSSQYMEQFQTYQCHLNQFINPNPDTAFAVAVVIVIFLSLLASSLSKSTDSAKKVKQTIIIIASLFTLTIISFIISLYAQVKIQQSLQILEIISLTLFFLSGFLTFFLNPDLRSQLSSETKTHRFIAIIALTITFLLSRIALIEATTYALSHLTNTWFISTTLILIIADQLYWYIIAKTNLSTKPYFLPFLHLTQAIVIILIPSILG